MRENYRNPVLEYKVVDNATNSQDNEQRLLWCLWLLIANEAAQPPGAMAESPSWINGSSQHFIPCKDWWRASSLPIFHGKSVCSWRGI